MGGRADKKHKEHAFVDTVTGSRKMIEQSLPNLDILQRLYLEMVYGEMKFYDIIKLCLLLLC